MKRGLFVQLSVFIEIANRVFMDNSAFSDYSSLGMLHEVGCVARPCVLKFVVSATVMTLTIPLHR